MIGIYKITSPTGKVYIGQSVDIKNRKWKYTSCCCKNQTKVYNSLKKYGWKNHTFEVITECNEEELNKLEVFYIEKYDSYKNGLNSTPGGLSTRFSEEHKNKISKALKGRKRLFCTIYKQSRAIRGRRLSQERIDAIRLRTLNNKTFLQAQSKLVLDTQYGVYYDSLKQAVKVYNLNYNTTKGRLNGSKPNNTHLIYA